MAGRRKVVPQVHVTRAGSGYDIALSSGAVVTVLEEGLSRAEALSRARTYIAAYKASPQPFLHEEDRP